MKKSILILGCFLISCVAFGYTPIESNTDKTTELSVSVSEYPVIASTEKGYGTEYSIGATVHGEKTSYSKSMNKVTVKGRSVNYSTDYNRTDWYYFSYDGERYYFHF